ncbi:protein of unknown function [Streptomyces sp. KY75]|nr:protein of unknown function [Streptomyces sp. KY75]
MCADLRDQQLHLLGHQAHVGVQIGGDPQVRAHPGMGEQHEPLVGLQHQLACPGTPSEQQRAGGPARHGHRRTGRRERLRVGDAQAGHRTREVLGGGVAETQPVLGHHHGVPDAGNLGEGAEHPSQVGESSDGSGHGRPPACSFGVLGRDCPPCGGDAGPVSPSASTAARPRSVPDTTLAIEARAASGVQGSAGAAPGCGSGAECRATVVAWVGAAPLRRRGRPAVVGAGTRKA